jgi:hypothetical protein
MGLRLLAAKAAVSAGCLRRRERRCPAMADTTDTANVIIRPTIVWTVAVLAGLALNWLVPLPFAPAAVPAGWLGAMVFVLALALFA